MVLFTNQSTQFFKEISTFNIIAEKGLFQPPFPSDHASRNMLFLLDSLLKSHGPPLRHPSIASVPTHGTYVQWVLRGVISAYRLLR